MKFHRHEYFHKGHALVKQLLDWGIVEWDTLPLSLLYTLDTMYKGPGSGRVGRWGRGKEEEFEVQGTIGHP